jgi:HTH-type transcriptional regulator, quorum sensing regulator NprR
MTDDKHNVEAVNIGKAVAARVGSNIREVRTKLGMTQANLAAPEFSISYISAIERGKIRPSLKALSILARRLDVSLTFLLEGTPAGADKARAAGYNSFEGRNVLYDVLLGEARFLIRQGEFEAAKVILDSLEDRQSGTDQVHYRLMLIGEWYLRQNQGQEALVKFMEAYDQAVGMKDRVLQIRALLRCSQAYIAIRRPKLGVDPLTEAATLLEKGEVDDTILKSEISAAFGHVYLLLGKVREALKEYREVEELRAGDHVSTLIRVAKRYREAGLMNAAWSYVQLAGAIMTSGEDQHDQDDDSIGLAEALCQAHEYEECQGYLERLLKRTQHDSIKAKAYVVYANLLLAKAGGVEDASGLLSKALQYANTAIRLAGGMKELAARAHWARGDILYSQGAAIGEITKAFNQARELMPTGQMLARYGEILDKMGRATQAGQMYKAAYELDRSQSE